ncbi:hypothetical protein BKA61DRAFT_603231 [Leptodontidium sp. MPI-SDFR-AT-0119]|nr:hypothetical protein BKA61DRAFT_603231 [Leptodontidium sp. MPI-SDFR-AT-0119]
MGKNRFENIIVEFAPKFENLKPLARYLRSTHNITYDGMIMAFNSAIGRLVKEEQAIAKARRGLGS